MKIKIKSNEPLYLENKGFLVYLVGMSDTIGQESDYLVYIDANVIKERHDGVELNKAAQLIMNKYEKHANDVIVQAYTPPIRLAAVQYFYTNKGSELTKKHGFWHESFLNDV